MGPISWYIDENNTQAKRIVAYIETYDKTQIYKWLTLTVNLKITILKESISTKQTCKPN